MKYLLSLLIAGILGAANIMADTPVDMTPTPDDTEEQEDSDRSVKKENPNRGRRTPPAPVRCIIDFENGTITGTEVWIHEVTEYQLRNAEGTCKIFVGTDETTFVQVLSAQPAGEYVIAVRGSGYILLGSIVL